MDPVRERRCRWVPDDEAPNCRKCAETFSFLTRRHHCRLCGNVFCSKCSNHYTYLRELGYHEPQRVCNDCLHNKAFLISQKHEEHQGKKQATSEISPDGSQKKWVPDEEATRCGKCAEEFSLITRRHHCRKCGNIFCAKCSDHFPFLRELGFAERERVCDECYIQKLLQSVEEDQPSVQKSDEISPEDQIISGGERGKRKEETLKYHEVTRIDETDGKIYVNYGASLYCAIKK